METFKWFLRSKRIWGVVVMLLAWAGINIPPELEEQLPQLSERLFNDIAFWVGAITSIYGSFVAKDKLTILPASAPLPWRKKP